jgi:alkanesulfonate monooxygenase SsuD/methylene tetrahydromethanopterin reductase-like flavin-dependent oxidoreductase (luciferase family)
MTVHIGVVLPQSQWSYTLEAARWAEETGADSLWVIDHINGFPVERGILEAWTVLCMLAGETTRPQLGAQVFCQSFRSPALLAKMAATFDHIAPGRLRLLIGAGWYEGEYEAFGYPFPPAGKRVDELRESVKILKGMLSGSDEPFSHGPVTQVRNIPAASIGVEIGGVGDRIMRLTAEEAAGWNTPGAALERLDDRLAKLDEELARAGRKRSELVVSAQIVCAVGDDEAKAHPGLGMFSPEQGLVGSVDQAVQRAGELMAKGVSGFHCVLAPGSKGRACFERLQTEVRPQLG